MLSLSLVLLVGWLCVLLRKRFVSCYGFIGYIAILAFQVALVLLPCVWIISLFPSRHSLASPEMFGIGGGVFGIQYEYYRRALLLLSTISVVGIMGAVVYSATKPPIQLMGAVGVSTLPQRWTMIVRERNLDKWLCIACFLVFALYFTANGWGRLWHSDLGRFDQSYIQLFSFLEDLKIFLPLLLLGGTLAAAALAVASRPWWSITAILFCLMPFISQASRGFSVLVPFTVVALMYRWRLPRVIALCILTLLFAYSLYMPLGLRGQPDTGMMVFFRQNALLFDGEARYSEMLSAVGQNLSQGFPILVDTIARQSGGEELMSENPAMYWVLSFSPTISLIDGFGGRYVQYTPFVNFYTPFSAFAELYVLSIFLFLGLPVIWFWSYLVMIRKLQSTSWVGVLLSVIILVLLFSALIQAHQYPIRTTMRFVYLGGLLGLAGITFLKAPLVHPPGMFNRQPRRSDVNTSRIKK
ncbi:hypothetical protein RAHE111665_17640 [Rariglobus hedericola]